MREYTLNDIRSTPGPIEPLPIGEGIDNATEEELRAVFQRNREDAEQLLRDFEERQRTGNLIM